MGETWSSRVVRIRTGCGNMYVTICRNIATRRQETIFVNLGKAGGCARAQTETISRLTTVALEHGASLTDIAHKLKGLSCNAALFTCSSCADAVAQAILEDDRLESENSDGQSEPCEADATGDA